METRTIEVTTTTAQFPEGTQASGWRFTIKDSDGNTVQANDVDAKSVSFDLDAGTYTASCVRLDMSNNPLGPEVESDPFTIDQGTIDIEVPATVTVS